MPPKRNQRTQAQKKEDAEKKKKILSAKERILAKRNFIMKIVENMIEDNVSEEWFLSNCSHLSQGDFDDVVQERSIESKENMFLCGFPLCSNITKQTIKQKFHISQVKKKVYDLKERKYFCTEECYKASIYVKAQLSPIPLWMRKEEKIKIHLLSECENKGSAGEEVLFHHTIPRDEIDKVYNEESTNNLQNLLNEEVKKCADSLSGLQIKERSFEKQYVFTDETPNESSSLKDKNATYSESEFDSDDSEDEKLFPSYDNESALSNRHMPIPEKIKKSVLIPPQKSDIKPISPANELSLNFVRKVFKDWMTEDTLKYLMGEKHVYGVKADHLFKTMTEAEFSSSERLASIKDEYIKLCLKIDSLPDDDDINDYPELDLIESDIKCNPKKTAKENNSVKKVFKRRPRNSKDKNKRVTFAPESEKTDLQQEEKSVDSSKEKKDEISEKNIVDEQQTEKNVTEISNEKKCQSEVNVDEKNNTEISNEKKCRSEVNVDEKNNTEISNEKKCQSEVNVDEKNNTEISIEKECQSKVNVDEKNITEISNEKECQSEVNEDVPSNNAETEEERPSEDLPEPKPAFPLVDSISQNILRRQVLIKKLKSVYTELLPIVGLHYTDIREHVRRFGDSLSLTPTNIIYKPKEWKLISLVLYRILTRTVLKDLHDELKFAKLCEDPLMPITVDLREVENLVCELCSVENIVSVH